MGVVESEAGMLKIEYDRWNQSFLLWGLCLQLCQSQDFSLPKARPIQYNRRFKASEDSMSAIATSL